VATMAVEKGLQVGWQAVTGKAPPAVPENPHSTWRKPLVWAMVSGALVGATRLFATRAAAASYAAAEAWRERIPVHRQGHAPRQHNATAGPRMPAGRTINLNGRGWRPCRSALFQNGFQVAFGVNLR